MALVVTDLDGRTRRAVAADWTKGAGDGLAEFAALVLAVVKENGVPDAEVHVGGAEVRVAGFYRAMRAWDVVVTARGRVLAVVNVDRVRGPEYAADFERRADTAIAAGHDMMEACNRGVFGASTERPWVGRVVMVRDGAEVRRTVSDTYPLEYGAGWRDFAGASLVEQYALLLSELVKGRVYDGAALMVLGEQGNYRQEWEEISVRRVLVGIAARAAVWGVGG